MIKSYHLRVYGFVQGVGYRKFVRKEALSLGLNGWVRNLPDNTVEIGVTGDEEKIKKLIEECKKGPFLSEVETIDVFKDEKVTPCKDFVIRHDLD